MRANHLTRRIEDRSFKAAVEEALRVANADTLGESTGAKTAESQATADAGGRSLSQGGRRSKVTGRSRTISDGGYDGWLWSDDGAEDLVIAANNAPPASSTRDRQDNHRPVTRPRRGAAEIPTSVGPAIGTVDESATEDLVLCQPSHAADAPGEDEPMQPGVCRRGVAPKRIGRGTLVPARLTWKPGDPFGGEELPRDQRFRWEVMLTSACVTAACGMLCVWLLHSILA